MEEAKSIGESSCEETDEQIEKLLEMIKTVCYIIVEDHIKEKDGN